jgi:hypothetical protein
MPGGTGRLYYGAARKRFQEESNRLGEALDAISVLPQ